jgi:hypothetical protein
MKQLLLAAQKAGAKSVRVRLSDGAEAEISLCASDENSVAPEEQIRL